MANCPVAAPRPWTTVSWRWPDPSGTATVPRPWRSPPRSWPPGVPVPTRSRLLWTGVFALAHCDAASRTLTVVCDRFGALPVYWRERDGIVTISTELKVLAEPGREALDEVAFDEFMAMGYLLGPHTLLAGVHRLPAHHALVCSPAGHAGRAPARSGRTARPAGRRRGARRVRRHGRPHPGTVRRLGAVLEHRHERRTRFAAAGRGGPALRSPPDRLHGRRAPFARGRRRPTGDPAPGLPLADPRDRRPPPAGLVRPGRLVHRGPLPAQPHALHRRQSRRRCPARAPAARPDRRRHHGGVRRRPGPARRLA